MIAFNNHIADMWASVATAAGRTIDVIEYVDRLLVFDSIMIAAVEKHTVPATMQSVIDREIHPAVRHAVIKKIEIAASEMGLGTPARVRVLKRVGGSIFTTTFGDKSIAFLDNDGEVHTAIEAEYLALTNYLMCTLRATADNRVLLIDRSGEVRGTIEGNLP